MNAPHRGVCWCGQAFAWYSDLMVEHSEIFWSLFAVDMDAVLELQPPDTWDSFPLFQNLNDYLRVHGKTRVECVSHARSRDGTRSNLARYFTHRGE